MANRRPGPLATSWHINKFLNPIRDGAVLPILHLNGYKINNPTLLARITHEELEEPAARLRLDALLRGRLGSRHHAPGDGGDRGTLHPGDPQASTGMPEHRRGQPAALADDRAAFPKGWSAPQEVDGHRLEGFWRAHQVPLTDVKKNPEQLRILEEWMRGYKPEELFDENGKLIPELKELAPTGTRRMSANPHANGGILKKTLRLPDFRDYAVKVDSRERSRSRTSRLLGNFLRDVMKSNMNNFRVFGPDETTSNKLQAIYEVSKKFWIAEYFPEDEDGGELATDGRVIEMLSEHTMEGMLEGYLLTGRQRLLLPYEAFVHVIDSMFNQHAKWLAICNHLSWRRDDRLAESADHFDRLAAGPQRFHPSGSRLPRRGAEQERRGHAHLSSARRQLSAVGGRSLSAGARTTST